MKRGLLMIVFFLLFCSPAFAEKTLKFSFSYSNATITLENISLVNGSFARSSQHDEYVIFLLNKDGKRVFNDSFDFPLFVAIEGKGVFQLNESDAVVYTPYSSAYKTFQIISPQGTMVLEGDIPEFEKSSVNLLFIISGLLVLCILILIMLRLLLQKTMQCR